MVAAAKNELADFVMFADKLQLNFIYTPNRRTLT